MSNCRVRKAVDKTGRHALAQSLRILVVGITGVQTHSVHAKGSTVSRTGASIGDRRATLTSRPTGTCIAPGASVTACSGVTACPGVTACTSVTARPGVTTRTSVTACTSIPCIPATSGIASVAPGSPAIGLTLQRLRRAPLAHRAIKIVGTGTVIRIASLPSGLVG
jgi:hypothetical protein